jgi:hypothetical protein
VDEQPGWKFAARVQAVDRQAAIASFWLNPAHLRKLFAPQMSCKKAR